jgi:hypothetical protein
VEAAWSAPFFFFATPSFRGTDSLFSRQVGLRLLQGVLHGLVDVVPELSRRRVAVGGARRSLIVVFRLSFVFLGGATLLCSLLPLLPVRDFSRRRRREELPENGKEKETNRKEETWTRTFALLSMSFTMCFPSLSRFPAFSNVDLLVVLRRRCRCRTHRILSSSSFSFRNHPTLLSLFSTRPSSF